MGWRGAGQGTGKSPARPATRPGRRGHGALQQRLTSLYAVIRCDSVPGDREERAKAPESASSTIGNVIVRRPKVWAHCASERRKNKPSFATSPPFQRARLTAGAMIFDEPVRGRVPPPWFWALPGIKRVHHLRGQTTATANLTSTGGPGRPHWSRFGNLDHAC